VLVRSRLTAGAVQLTRPVSSGLPGTGLSGTKEFAHGVTPEGSNWGKLDANQETSGLALIDWKRFSPRLPT